jgi:hypothetical protein
MILPPTSHRAHRASDPHAIIPTPNRRRDRPSKPDGLTKQTYSALVYFPGTSKPRKWHVVAYFSVSLAESFNHITPITSAGIPG